MKNKNLDPKIKESDLSQRNKPKVVGLALEKEELYTLEEKLQNVFDNI